jgi:hypothetical protein
VKCIKLKMEKMKLVMGVDVVMDQVLIHQGTTIVGKFHGRIISDKSMSQWICQVWKQQLGYAPIFCMLTREWITFILKVKEGYKNHPTG